MGFYSIEQLKKIGFKSIGENVLISDKTSIYGAGNISIGSNVRIDDFVVLSATEGYIQLGDYIHIAVFCGIFGAGGIEIKDYSTTSSRVMIYSISDDYSGETMTNPMIPKEYKNIEYGKVVLEKHTIVGSGTVILPGVILREGSAIGVNSLVKKSTDSWGIYAGNPVKKIKSRKKELLNLEKEFINNKRGETSGL